MHVLLPHIDKQNYYDPKCAYLLGQDPHKVTNLYFAADVSLFSSLTNFFFHHSSSSPVVSEAVMGSEATSPCIVIRLTV